jgi:hypothetical protein
MGGFVGNGGLTGTGGLGLGNFPGTGGVSGSGGAGAGGVLNNVTSKLGPASENVCQDMAKFAGAGPGGKLLYPYDGTIFPKGLLGPLLQWEGDAEQILFEAKSAQWNYTACPATPDRVRWGIPDDIWARASSYSDGTADPLNVKITTFAGGKVSGQITVNLIFALATLKGAIYYNTYGAPGSLTNGNGAVMKITPGKAIPAVFLTDTPVLAGNPIGPCRSCHALSANGMMMTANHHAYPGFYESEAYDVAGPTPTLIKGQIPEAGFAGIYPDGSRLMTNGPPNDSTSFFFPTGPGNVAALVKSTAKLIDSRTGNPLNAVGWDAPHAQMPMFSPKGELIVYNDSDKGAGHSLWMAHFDPATNTFSGQKEIYKHADKFPAWPFFTPDSKKIIFALGTRSDFCSQVPDITGPPLMTPTGQGLLVIVDVATGQATNLDVANGYKNGQSYLPAGEARDNNLEFFPTVSPFAAGGFFWTFFTSRRTYGNVSTVGIEDPIGKKLWASAIDMDSPSGTDPSHPPFLIPGQELNAGNLRAFGALEPCKEDGASCTTGSDCCKGFCSQINPTTGIGVCGKIIIDQCPKFGDRCEEDKDCCTGPDNGVNGKKLFCINNICEPKDTM